MIKVLYIVSHLRKCGPVIQLYNLIKYLDRSVFEPYIITLSIEEKKNSYLNEFLKINVNVKSLALNRLFGFIYGPVKIKKLTKQIEPHIIHSQGIRADWLNAKFFKNYISYSTLQNYPYEDYMMTYGKLYGFLMAKFHIYTLKNITFPVAVSNSISKKLLNKIKFHTILNGVDQEIYKYPDSFDEKKNIRSQLQLPLDLPIIIYSGHLTYRKDPLTVIRAFLSEKLYNKAVLVFCGRGNLERKCKELARGYDNIVFRGYVKNIKDYLNAADIYVSASLSEGMPNSVLEALACRVPVCLSDIPQHKEILNENPEAGLCFVMKDYKVLAECLITLISENANTDRKNAAYQIVNDKFNAKYMSLQYQEYYIKSVEMNESKQS